MKPKIIDQKTTDKLLDRIKTLANSYTPDWHPDMKNPDFGSALALIFRDMYIEQIDRVNRTADKQRRDLVNLLDPSPIRPTSSKGFVSFLLNESALQGQFIDSGFQLLSENGEDSEIYFETAKPLYISDARIVKSFVYDHEHGWLSAHLAHGTGIDFPLFEIDSALNINKAGFTLSDSKWLALREGMTLGLDFGTSHDMDTRRLLEGLSSENKARFTLEYGDETHRLRASVSDGMLYIEVPEKILMSGKLTCTFLDLTYFRDIDITRLNLHVITHAMAPHAILNNDTPIEMSRKHKAILPFGDTFNVFDTFMLGDSAFFFKPGAEINLSFKVKTFLKSIEQVGEEPIVKWRNIMHESELREPEAKRIRIDTLTWEYWNGKGWMTLQTNGPAQSIPEDGLWQISFTCPDDIESAVFGPQEYAYIRARITKVENAFAPVGDTAVPMFYSVTMQIDTRHQLQAPQTVPEALVLTSNLEERVFERKHIGNQEIELVSPPDLDLYKAVYIALSKPLDKGPIRIEASPVFTESSDTKALYKLQYHGVKSGREGWHDMRHEDETDGFTVNGLISFMAPGLMTPAQRFNEHKFWIRIVPIGSENGLIHPQKYHRNINLRMNGVSVTQQETLEAEYFSTTSIQPNTRLTLSRAPLLDAEVWINELGYVSESYAAELKSNCPNDVRIEHDKNGERAGVWIRWKQIESFANPHSDMRVYTLDIEQGLITFGDGKTGKIPHSELEEFIEVKYRLGGGIEGNVAALKINKAVMGIPFLERVYNGNPMWGGLSSEWNVTAEKRICNFLRHRGMALSVSDIKAIVMASVRDVYDIQISGKDGFLNISILPNTFPYQTSHFYEIKNRAEQALENTLSHTVCTQQRYDIKAPVHVAYSINMDVAVTLASDYIKALSSWQERLDAYFHPLSGGVVGRGWKIGDLPDHTKVLTDLKHMMEGTERIENVMIQRHIVSGNKKIPLGSKSLPKDLNLAHAIPVSGSHDIRIKIQNA